MKDTYSMFNLKKCNSISKPDTVHALVLMICPANFEDITYWQWPQRSCNPLGCRGGHGLIVLDLLILVEDGRRGEAAEARADSAAGD